MYRSYGLLINNSWRAAADGSTKTVISPVTEEEIGTIPNATNQDLDDALQAADDGLRLWRAIPAWDRAAILRQTAGLIRDRVVDIAQIMATETGKPLAEAYGETNAAADQFEWYAEEAKRVYGQTIPGRAADQRLSVVYQPVGVCVSLSAWNFPALLPSRKIAAALAAGCSVIARPASEAPGSCFAIVQALIDAGLPGGVLGVVTGEASRLSEHLLSSPIVRKVSFTGSVPVGKQILALAAAGVKRVSMELGGHAPAIVHADADPVMAAEVLATAKFRNCGQVCISPSRFFVHQSIKSAFETAFSKVADSLTVGDGRREGVTTGPMIRARALDNALSLIEDAKAKGADLLAGGQRPAHLNKGHFLQPTVLTNVPNEARIMVEEPFAPIAPITGFTQFADVLARANDVPFGLAGYVFTNDAALGQLTAEGLEVGMVGINEVLLAAAEAPFGGIKESGFGREGGTLGIKDYLEAKYIKQRLIRGTEKAYD